MNIIELERELTELVKTCPHEIEIAVGDETLLSTKKTIKHKKIKLNGIQYLLAEDPRWYLCTNKGFERLSSNWKDYGDLVIDISKITGDILKENGIEVKNFYQFNIQLIGASKDPTPSEVREQLYDSIGYYLASKELEADLEPVKAAIEQKIKSSFFANKGKNYRFYKSKALVNSHYPEKDLYTDKGGNNWLLLNI